MTDGFTFLNANWFWHVFLGIMLLGSVFFWKEWHHFGTKRFQVKSALIMLTLFALSMLVLKPAMTDRKAMQKVVVLTDNYAERRLDSLRNAYPELSVLRYKTNTSIFESAANPKNVFVLGQGVASPDMWQLADKNVCYLGDTLPSGLIKYRYNTKNIVGESLVFRGLFNRPKKGNRLILQGPHGVGLDSVYLDTISQQEIKLTTTLKATGNYVFNIVEKDQEGKYLSVDPLPVTVENMRLLKIMLINGFPTFESKYLKNYLAEMGHEVAARSQLTKGRYKYEYFNGQKRTIGNFTAAEFQFFDLVIMDAKTLRNLSSTSRNALQNSIHNGLGLFVQLDKNWFKNSGSWEHLDLETNVKTNISLEQNSKIKIEKYPYLFQQKFGLEAVQLDGDSGIVTAFKHRGNGKVGATLLANTYELLFKGQQKEYQQLWAAIIAELCRGQNPKTSWKSQTHSIRKDHPFDFELRTSVEDPEVQTDQGYQIAIQNNIDLPQVWSGRSYPVRKGWHSLILPQDSTSSFNYFVQDTLAWKAKNQYETAMANHRISSRSAQEIGFASVVKPISPLVFFIVFLISMGMLWLLPKL